MKPMKPLKEQISITLDGDILDRIRQLADEDDRSISSTINLILRNYLREHRPPKET